MRGLKEVKTDSSVLVAMSIANTEACLSGSGCIEMIHILQAILNVVDDQYDAAAESLNLMPEEIKSVREMAARCRERLNIPNERITAIRRQLHKILTSRHTPAPISKLSCSNESMYLLQKAARRSHNFGAEEMSLVFLLEEVLENLPGEVEPLFRSQGKTKEVPAP